MSRNRWSQRRAALRGMPLRLWLVVERDAHSDENSPRLIVARCPSQAAKVWRGATGYTLDDVPVDDLRIEPAVWEWPTVPEPVWPKMACAWWPKGRAPDGDELYRGYGLRDADDIRCVGCDELTAEDRIVRVPNDYEDTEPMCPHCVAEARAQVQP